jgi:hypothetical protein
MGEARGKYAVEVLYRGVVVDPSYFDKREEALARYMEEVENINQKAVDAAAENTRSQTYAIICAAGSWRVQMRETSTTQ